MPKYLQSLWSYILGLIVLTLFVFSVLYTRLPHLLSQKLSHTLQTHVSIDTLTIRPFSLQLSGISIDNTPHSTLPKALTMETATIAAPLLHYLNDSIAIEEILLDTIYLGLEFDSASSAEGNWTTLMTPLQNSEKSSSTKSVHIQTLTLRNITVEIVYKDTGTKKRLPLIPEITLSHIDSTEGLPTDQIMKSVLGQMLRSVFIKENLRNMIENILPSPKSTLDSVLKPFRNLFGGEG